MPIGVVHRTDDETEALCLRQSLIRAKARPDGSLFSHYAQFPVILKKTYFKAIPDTLKDTGAAE